MAIPIAIYKVLVSTFGMDSPASFQVVAVALFLISVGLLFVYVRARVGAWPALAAILPILFLGQAWDDLLFPFQMSLFGSMACGIGALLALDRHDRPGDLAATGLLLGSLLFSDVGIAFVAAVALELALSRDRLRRAYVVAAPTFLWLVWYAGWGHNANTHISFRNLANLTNYVPDGVATSLASLVGLSARLGDYQSSPLDWGRPLLVLGVALLAWRLYVLRRPSDRLLAAVALLLGFWSLTALNASPIAPATAGRYQYIGTILIVILAAELAKGLRVGRWVVAGIVVGAGAAALSNGYQLRDWAHGLQQVAEQERGGLGALELDRSIVDPRFELTPQNSGVDYLGLMDAGSYLSAADAYGSPAYSEAELATAPEAARVSADMVSAAILQPTISPAERVTTAGCTRTALGHGPAVQTVPRSSVILVAGPGHVSAALRRYASESFPVALGSLARGTQQLQIPPDPSPRRWVLELTGTGAVTVCKTPGA